MSSVYEFAEPNVRPERHGPSDFPDDLTMKEAPSISPLQDASRTKRLVPWQHESRLFVMMIRINDRKRDTVHESFFGIPSYFEEGEFNTVTVRRDLSFHAGPVPGVTIMRQEQAVSIHINHRDRIVRNSTRCHLVKDCITSRCHANGRCTGMPIPLPCQVPARLFSFSKAFCASDCAGGHSRVRHLSNGCPVAHWHK